MHQINSCRQPFTQTHAHSLRCALYSTVLYNVAAHDRCQSFHFARSFLMRVRSLPQPVPRAYTNLLIARPRSNTDQLCALLDILKRLCSNEGREDLFAVITSCRMLQLLHNGMCRDSALVLPSLLVLCSTSPDEKMRFPAD